MYILIRTELVINTKNHNTKLLYWLIACAAFLPRLFFIFYAPVGGGDWDIYSTVAENILSGCGVSLSIPGEGECKPHFGGNQGPGYPAFVALIWWLGGHSDMLIRVVQAMIGITVIVYTVRAVLLYTSSFKIAAIVGIVLALSPLEVAWPRYLQTETLAMAGTLWVFSELLLSLHESKIRILPLSVALIITTFIRLDAVLLVLPIATTVFIIYKPYQAIKKGLILAVLFSLPWGGWLARNHMSGMENIFPLAMTAPNNAESPNGYLKWLWTWSTDTYHNTNSLWPVTRFNYDSIGIDERAYYTIEEKNKVSLLLSELKQYTGKPFPKHIDSQFRIIAEKRTFERPLEVWVLNPIKRSISLWSNIYSSFGWPTELPSSFSKQVRIDISRNGVIAAIPLILEYPVQAAGKIIVNGWRVVVIFLFIASLLISRNDKVCRDILLLSLAFILARTLFSGFGNYVETRYTLMQMPIMEISIIISMLFYQAKRLSQFKKNV